MTKLTGVGGAAATAAAAAADRAAKACDRRVGTDDVHELDELLLHRLIGDALVAPDIAHEAALIDIGKKS